MNLAAFAPSRDAFYRAVKSGQLTERNPIAIAAIGNGAPIWPSLALRGGPQLPSAAQLAAAVETTTNRLVPVVRGLGTITGAVGVVAGAFSPLAAVVGKLAGPTLAGLAGSAGTAVGGPGVGAAASGVVGVVAQAAGPIVAAGGAVAGAVGGVAAGAPDPATLRKLGTDVENQIVQLTETLAASSDAPVTTPSTPSSTTFGPQP